MAKKVVHNGGTSLKRVKSGGRGGGIVADEEKGMQPETAGEPGSQAANQPVQGGNSTPDTLEAAFFGSYDPAIDGKGRIIVPSDYRDALG